jgi:hypothetical protein
MRRNRMDDRVQDEVDKEEDYDPFEDTSSLTQEQANNYLRNGGVECPYCGSENIQGVNRDMGDATSLIWSATIVIINGPRAISYLRYMMRTIRSLDTRKKRIFHLAPETF